LRILGDGESRAEVEEAALRDSSISFEGWVGEDVVFDLMRGAEAVLVPSKWYEGGGPLVTLRSLAVGTPVVISDLANISDLVKRDESGVAFRPGDAADFARVLSDVAADRVGWAARRQKARASYEKRYSPTVDIERLERIYSEVSNG
jgi:glycosyltransferase involved in cell wall biosynthesis